MRIIESLLARIEAHCLAKQISESTFGRMAVNDGKFVRNLRAGRTITVSTVEKVHAYLDDPDK